MPTYDYVCDACGHEFEQFQSITARPLKKCPSCAQRELKRLIGTGGGIIFKGSGFYETDYRSESYKKSAEAEKKAASDTKDGKGDKAAKSKDAKASPSETKQSSEKQDKASTPGKPAGSGRKKAI